MISKSQVRKAGDRIADGDLSPDNIRAIEEYRSTFDSLLVDTSDIVNRTLATTELSFLVSGRPKRTSSIRRKLIRSREMENRMNVANMADLVGARVIVSNLETQDAVARELVDVFGSEVTARDYRSRTVGYRAIHLIRRTTNSQRIEIQIRTLPQHVWAVESESFDQQVKEGGGRSEIRIFLDQELSPVCKAIDEEVAFNLPGGQMFADRAPTKRFLPNITRLFEQATKGYLKPRGDTTYVVVFDSRLSLLTRVEPFHNDRKRAAREYNRLCGMLDQNRFDVVVLNSRTREAIAVTHPNFFPRVQFGKFE